MAKFSCNVFRLHSRGKLCLEQEWLGTVPEPHFYAKTLFSAISPGTELSAYSGEPHLRSQVQYPRLMGYLNIARVIENFGVQNVASGSLILSHQSHRSAFFGTERDILAILPEGFPPHVIYSYIYWMGLCCINPFDERQIEELRICLLGLGTISSALYELLSIRHPSVSGITSRLDLNVGSNDFLDRGQAKQLNASQDICVLGTNGWEDYFLGLEILRKKGALTLLGFPGRIGLMPNRNPLDPTVIYAKNLIIRSLPSAPNYKKLGDFEISFRAVVNLLLEGLIGVTFRDCTIRDAFELPNLYKELLRIPSSSVPKSFILKWPD